MSTPLRQQLNTILADMRTQQARIQAASERLGNATASATSKDRAIEAVVDNRGRVTALKLKGTGYRKLPPAELADRIADTIRSAPAIHSRLDTPPRSRTGVPAYERATGGRSRPAPHQGTAGSVRPRHHPPPAAIGAPARERATRARPQPAPHQGTAESV